MQDTSAVINILICISTILIILALIYKTADSDNGKWYTYFKFAAYKLMHIIKPNPKNVNAVLYILISKNKKKKLKER